MSKRRYKIPVSLDVTFFDMEFNIKSKNGVGINKPVAAKNVLIVVFSMFAWFYIINQTFIGKGAIPITIGFTISWIILSFLLLRPDKTRRMGLELVLSMINYLPKSGRHVPVRMSDSIYQLQILTNIRTVDKEDGMIRFLDGAIGHCYHIVGSASNLMFEEDKDQILNKVDAFYRKLPVGVEVIYDTVYEGHTVEQQLEGVLHRKAGLKLQSKGLEALLEEQYQILDVSIGRSKNLMSLHQYLVVRAVDEDALQEFENLVLGDVEGDGLMFRLAKSLNYADTTRYLKAFLSDGEIARQ